MSITNKQLVELEDAQPCGSRKELHELLSDGGARRGDMRYDACLKHIDLRLDEIAIESQSADREKRRKLNSEAKFLDVAKDAIKKQIPIKPKLVFGENTNTHRYGRLISLHCPSCGRFILALYEMDMEKGGGISNDLRGCSKCLQAIDFTGYYHKSEENEEVIFDD